MKYNAILSIILLAFSLLLSSCATSTAETQQPEQQKEKPVVIKTITVLPVNVAIDEKVPIDPIQKQQLLEGKEILNKLIQEQLAGQPSISYITENQIKGLKVDFSLCTNFIERTRAICLNIGSDAALAVNLKRFRQRAGKTYGVEHPASVAFDYRLIEVKTGKTLCWGKFNETQKPPLDDMFSFFDKIKKRGVKWITAEELAREGVQSKLGACAYLNAGNTTQ